MDEIQRKLNQIKYCIEDARAHNGLYSSTHTELEWLVEKIEEQQQEIAKLNFKLGGYAGKVHAITEEMEFLSGRLKKMINSD
ncbi:hypothetical protein [Cytobacillus firmus]|uniref:hypothetical protein n=1 Tax=Cytobacillus firmus TaxID=1399 RepID=UPI0018CDE61D|nr:hypothetical protein [Cytobacillus firmus]MBG9587392.1 hypothetical protein [Cytobacillus firmus]